MKCAERPDAGKGYNSRDDPTCEQRPAIAGRNRDGELPDAAALGLAWLAVRIAKRPADWKRTFGFDRFEVLAAFANGLALFFIAIAISYEALNRRANASASYSYLRESALKIGPTQNVKGPAMSERCKHR